LELVGFGFSEFDTLTLDVNTAQVDSVETGNTLGVGSITIADAPGLAFLLVGAGLGRVVLGLRAAATRAESGC
jgi:hypothetical protein